jgi:hypothetical protein
MKKLLLTCLAMMVVTIYAQENDWRNLENALSVIPNEGYCDQPYVVINKSGDWVCTLTTGPGHEGEPGQHVVATISSDKGKTWSELIDIEPTTGPEASWVVPFATPKGRIYAFYTYNSENWRTVLQENGKPTKRVDTFGKMMFKYSDDGGYTWSESRYEVPIRNFRIDDENIYSGDVQFFWSVAKPITHNKAMYLPLSKVGNFGEGFMVSGSGAILVSHNIMTEEDPEKITWKTLPEGNLGLLAPEGKVADEHNIVSLDDGSLFCVYRTNMGHNVHAYSRDNGYTWTEPEWATYSPVGKIMKQPRCFNKVYKFKNGKYLLFFHNNSSRHYSSHPLGNRNPTWLAGGIERDGFIYWSQPEIFLYDMDYSNGISYPDWIEDGGEYFFTETQKTVARLHQIPAEFLNMLWNQAEYKSVTKDGIILDKDESAIMPGIEFEFPELGKLSRGDGFTLEFILQTGRLNKDQLILDTRKEKTTGIGFTARYKGNGMVIRLLKEGGVEVLLDDGRSPLIWNSGENTIFKKHLHHIVIHVDAAAKMLYFTIDGEVIDGGERPFGYARFNPYMYDINGENIVAFPKEFKGKIKQFRIYNRPLYISEALGNYRSIVTE